LRGSPIDKVVSELMILVNSTWGKLLADNDVAGIYRTQSNGKVKMSTVAAPHQGLGVAQYMWSSSPLRRYIDLVNQRQIINLLRHEAPAYGKNDTALFAILRDFDAAYTLYNDFQRQMERYWCLRWLLQEKTKVEALTPTLSRVAGEGANESLRGLLVTVSVLRENLVRLADIPLVSRIPSLPEMPPNTQAILEIGEIDLLDLNFNARFISVIEAMVA
jgi:exoribonuclease-2